VGCIEVDGKGERDARGGKVCGRYGNMRERCSDAGEVDESGR
jgi:hypothetical protein